MNKKVIVIGIAVLVLGGIFFTLNKKGSNNIVQSLQNSLKNEITVGDDVCSEFPKEWVSSVLKKEIVKTEAFHMSGTNNCQYFVDDANSAFIKVENLTIENQKTGQKEMGRTITTDARIPMENVIAVQEDGLINVIYLVLTPNRFVAIDRTSTKVYDNEGEIAFAAQVAKRIQSGQNIAIANNETQAETKSQVPLPQGEDIVRNLFNLINEGKASDAVNMLTPSTISDDSSKQAWGVQFNAFEKITVKKIEPAGENTYEVTLDVKMKPGTENVQPMPYYGWGNGEFVRWVSLEKDNNVWKVTGIATGP
jgi:hypothetical protein